MFKTLLHDKTGEANQTFVDLKVILVSILYLQVTSLTGDFDLFLHFVIFNNLNILFVVADHDISPLICDRSFE